METNVTGWTDLDTSVRPSVSGLVYSITRTPTLLKNIEAFIGVLGFLANLKVVIVILNYRVMLKSRVNWYILNQSIIDMMVAVMLILATQFEDDGRYFSGPGDNLFCVLWISRIFLYGPMMSSTYNMLAMTIERYLSVVKPIWHKVHVTPFAVRMSMVFSWILGLVYQFMIKIPTFYVFEGHCLTYQYKSKVWGTIAAIVYAILFYFFPLLVIFYCYGHMTRSLRTRVQDAESSDGARHAGREKARGNVIKTLLLVAIAFIVCLTIDTWTFFFFNLGFKIDMSSNLHHTAVILMYLNCAINPFIYMIKYKTYQKGLRKLFRRFTRGVENEIGEGMSTANTLHDSATAT